MKDRRDLNLAFFTCAHSGMNVGADPRGCPEVPFVWRIRPAILWLTCKVLLNLLALVAKEEPWTSVIRVTFFLHDLWKFLVVSGNEEAMSSGPNGKRSMMNARKRLCQCLSEQSCFALACRQSFSSAGRRTCRFQRRVTFITLQMHCLSLDYVISFLIFF